MQDLGAALGKSRWPLGSRNVIEDFESQDLVTNLDNGRVTFDHHSRHKQLLKEISAADVVWACRLMARLTDRQLHDAFRAAQYPRDVRERYVRKIKQKIRQGLALETRTGSAA